MDVDYMYAVIYKKGPWLLVLSKGLYDVSNYEINYY